jgi:predicted ribosome quality control (RQC) complex YloA/Tae2 family protein
MKGLNQTELEIICEEIQTWVGAQLQEISAGENHIALGFYLEQKISWMVFDFATQSPLFLILEDGDAKRLPKHTKPLTLFLRAHFEARRILRIELALAQGRVLRIFFRGMDGEELSLEIILFSHAKNFIATAGKKKISFFKLKDIPLNEFAPQQEMSARSFHALRQEWLAEKGLQPKATLTRESSAAVSPQVLNLQKMILKKSGALDKMQADLKAKVQSAWGAAGEWIKLNQSLNVPEEFSLLIDPEKSLSQNISICFQKAKDHDRKVKVAADRIKLLEEEIRKLNLKLRQPFVAAAPLEKKSFLQKVGAQARTLKIDEGVQAYIGKSAKDNLDILRRAQAFDLWLHLRDVPSAHVVIRRTKGRVVTDAELRKIAQWLIAENFGKKSKEKSGEFFDLIVCECRFVKPIKGDKLGRVNFQNDRSLRVKFE